MVGGKGATIPCCACDDHFDQSVDCAQTKRRFGWDWLRVDEYPGLKDVNGIRSDLGYTMQPVVGHTMLETSTMEVLIWGGKEQFPPVDGLSIRDRTACLGDGCSGKRRQFGLTNAMWRWDLAKDTWQHGVVSRTSTQAISAMILAMTTAMTTAVISAMATAVISANASQEPEARWFHASGPITGGFFVHGGLLTPNVSETDMTKAYRPGDYDVSLRRGDLWYYQMANNSDGGIGSSGWTQVWSNKGAGADGSPEVFGHSMAVIMDPIDHTKTMGYVYGGRMNDTSIKAGENHTDTASANLYMFGWFGSEGGDLLWTDVTQSDIDLYQVRLEP